MSELPLIASLFTPLFVGFILHGVCIKLGWLGRLARPIDCGATLRGRPLFGPNKTYRGVIAVALGAALGYAAQAAFPVPQPPGLRHLAPGGIVVFGLAMGTASMLSELPNSLLKRQLDIAPGAPGRGLAAPISYVLDQVDLLIGAWLVAWPWVPPSPPRVLWSVVFVLVTHQVISTLGALLGMRASAR